MRVSVRCEGYRITSTGRSVRWITLCAVLPRTSPVRSLRPRLPITMTPTSCCFANSTISAAARPNGTSATSACVVTPASARAETAALTSSSASPPSSVGTSPMRGMTSRSRMCTTQTSPLARPASSLAAASARSEAAEWSIATRIFSYIADLLRSDLVLAARDPVGARQGYLGHGRRLDRERHEVVGFQVVHVGLAAGAGERGGLHDHRLEVVRDVPRAAVHVEPPFQLGVLGGDAHRAAAGVAVTGLGAQRPVAVRGVVIAAVLPVGGAVAAEGDQRGDPDRHRVRAER